MPSPRVLLVELDGLLAMHLSSRLTAAEVAVHTATAVDAVDRLVTETPDLVLINLELSQGSGFGLVNRLRRMEALTGLKIVLIADDAAPAALDAHRESATPADAYLGRVHDSSTAAFAEVVFDAVQQLLEAHLPELEAGELVELDAGDPSRHERLAAVIAELGGYRVLRRLQDEDGGAVFACMDEELDRAVAIKVMVPDEERDDAPRLQRFERERRILALLHSPHVVAIYGAGTHRGMPYIVRELIDGEDLETRLQREGALDVVTALQRVRETALGLKHAADAGVIHRDVRPANIHVVEDAGSQARAKLARFGMGRRQAAEEHRITRDGLMLPDLVYVAPERVRGQEDARGDIYALGVTLHTLIAGAPPFRSPAPVDPLSGELQEEPISLEAARPGTPPKVTALVARLMQQDPERRPQSYDEVLALIDDAAQFSSEDAKLPEELEEPSAVHGTLRLMGVVEIVQSLELATKTATVTLKGGDGSEGKLAFEAGRLVHASFGDERGTEAFFTLVAWRRGAFRVEYEASTLEHNVDLPTTALLLEAARRDDEAGAGERPAATTSPEPSLVVDPTLEPAFFDAASNDVEGDHRARQVSTAWGLVIIAVTTTLFVYAGFFVPTLWPDAFEDDAADRASHALLAETREQLRAARSELADVEPKLAAFEAQQASAATVDTVTRTLAAEVHQNLEAALLPELSARRLTLRLSDDGSEAVIEIGEAALFSGESDGILEDGKSALARLTGAIASLRNVHVRVEGHTDDTAPGARSLHRNNWGLSGARALAVAEVLTSQGLPKDRVSAVALADTAPVASNRGPKGRARNRRVELHLAPRVDVEAFHQASPAGAEP